MDTVGIRELKAHLSRHLKRVRAGRRLLVTERGRIIASIHPVDEPAAFEVESKANKHEIRDAVQQLFKVDVREVRTMVMHGKLKRVGRFAVKRANWKKAIVTLKEGQKIDFFGTAQSQ